MTKTQYKKARRLYRENGCAALNWMPRDVAMEMDMVLDQIITADPLAERADIIAYCQRVGIHCSVMDTVPATTLQRFYWKH